MTTDPDTSDPDAPVAVLGGHGPQEYRDVYGTVLGVACRRCFRACPCPSIVAARAADDPEQADPALDAAG